MSSLTKELYIVRNAAPSGSGVVAFLECAC
jgi:hypothetical protein